jgi:hypothetical protein
VWWPAVTWVIVAAGTLVNVLLSALDAPLHIMEVVKWGIYAAEYMMLVIWCSWGTGSQVFRLIAGIAVGALWMPASWIGYWIASPDRMGHYTHEMQQMLTVVPPAFAISMVPLCVMRWLGWRFFSHQSHAPLASPLAWVLLVAFAVGMLTCFYVDRWVGDDLVLSCTIGLVLGAIAAATAPLLSWGFLGHSIRPSFILLAWLPPVPIALLACGFFGYLGLEGIAGETTFAAVVAAIVAIGCLFMIFLCWRVAGLRLISQSVAEPSDAADSR